MTMTILAPPDDITQEIALAPTQTEQQLANRSTVDDVGENEIQHSTVAHEPLLSATLWHATVSDVSRWFEESERRLPVYRGTTLHEDSAAWRAQNAKETAAQWRKAAIAASIDRRVGQRNDGLTPIQQFCREHGIGPEYFSRLVRTYRVFDAMRDPRPLEDFTADELDFECGLDDDRNDYWWRHSRYGGFDPDAEALDEAERRRPLDPKIKRLLDDPFYSFTHFRIAATCAPSPKHALLEAKQMGWSATELARVLASRKNRRFLDDDGDKVHDDDGALDVEARQWPERVPPKRDTPRGMRHVRYLLTAAQFRIYRAQFRALGAALGTTSDVDTELAIVAKLHALLVSAGASDCAATQTAPVATDDLPECLQILTTPDTSDPIGARDEEDAAPDTYSDSAHGDTRVMHAAPR